MNHTKKWRSALSLLLALLMVAGQFGSVFAATIEEVFAGKETINYVSFGASNVNGFGMRGYLPDEAYFNPASKDQYNIFGYKMCPEGSYPDLIRAHLEELGYKVEVDQLAMSSMRAEEVRFMFDDSYIGDEYMDWRFYDIPGVGDDDSEDWYLGAGKIAYEELYGESADNISVDEAVAALRQVYRNDVKNADLITYDVGVNNFGVYLSGRVVNEDYLDIQMEDIAPEVAVHYEEAKEYIVNLLVEEYGEEILGMLEELKVEHIVDSLAYSLVAYCVNFDITMEAIYELNPDVTVVVVTIQNLMKDLIAKIDGLDFDLPLGDIVGMVTNLANAYMAVGSPYANKYYYADVRKDEHVEFFIDELVRYNGDPTTLNDDMTDCWDVYDSDIYLSTTVCDGLMSGFKSVAAPNVPGGMDTVNAGIDALWDIYTASAGRQLKVELPDGRVNYEPLLDEIIKDGQNNFVVLNNTLPLVPELAGWEDMLLQLAGGLYSGVAIYKDGALLAAYDATAKVMASGGRLNVLDFSQLTGDWGSVSNAGMQAVAGSIGDAVNAFMADPENYDYDSFVVEDDFFEQLAVKNGIDLDLMNTFAAYGVRTFIGNAFYAHPNKNGHKEIFNAVIEAIETEISGGEVVEEEVIHPALDELKKYYLENSSEINDQIYNYLLNNPKEVIEFIEANQGNTERQMAAIAVLAYMYNYYGGQAAVDALLADPAGTFDMFVDLMMTHGDNAYRLIKTYILAAELEEEDYENAFKFLVEMLKEYGPGIAQGIYDWAEEQGYIAEIKEAVEEFTGLVEDDVKEFIKVVQPKIEKAVKDLKNFVAEKKAEIAELKTKIETEILPKIEELKAEYAEKKAQYDVIMAHIDEYHPEEKAAVIAALEAELKALEEEIKANEAINNQVSEAIANISTEIADVEKLIAQLNGKLDEVGTELEKLAVISADLIKAVEKLAKVAIENIDEEAVEAEIMAVLNDLQTAADEMLYTLKEAWTFTELFTGIAASAEKLGNSLLAKAEKYEEVIGDEVGAVITELTKLLDGSTPAATETIKAIIADVKEIGGISEELAEEIADVAETVITEAGKLADVIAGELKAAVEKAYTNAVTGEYAYSADSYYVNIGDSITKGSNNYAKKLANELGLDEDFVDLGNAEYRAEDIRYILDENYTPDAYGKAVVKNVEALRKQYITEIEKADIITVGVGNLTPFMMTQVGKDIFGDEYEMDWAKLVGEDHVQYIEMALDEVKEFISQQELPEIPYKDIIDRFVKIDVEELVMTAVESYAYAYVGFAFNYAELVNDIHEINPDAEVVLVGAYNALPTLAVEGIELGEYIDSLVELMDLQFTVYGMITPNTTFVEVNDVTVERPVEDMMDLVLSIAAPELPSLVATLIGAKEAEINPSEAGHEYIKTQILDAISVTYYGLGDVNLDGEVDAKDATQILRYINGKTSVFDTQNKYKSELIRHNADVDYNVGIEAKDATQILRYCNGKTNTIEGRQ